MRPSGQFAGSFQLRLKCPSVGILSSRVWDRQTRGGTKHDDIGRLGQTAEQLLNFKRNNHAADLVSLAIAAGYEVSLESDSDTHTRQSKDKALLRAISNVVRDTIDQGGDAGAISSPIKPGNVDWRCSFR